VVVAVREVETVVDIVTVEVEPVIAMAGEVVAEDIATVEEATVEATAVEEIVAEVAETMEVAAPGNCTKILAIPKCM
jgi:hypothetical protein